MQMPDMPVNVPIDDPNADTEWNDILRKHGVIPEKPPSPTPLIEEALSQARALAHANRLEAKTLDELSALEDDEDASFLESYRQKRIAQLAATTQASVYHAVFHIQKAEYAREVTEASQRAFVLVLLVASQGANTESRVAGELWRELAAAFGHVKFCQMRADLCIEGYPDRNTPTVLVYRDGDVRRQVVTLRELGGGRTGRRDFERLLVEVGAVEKGDVRLTKDEVEEGGKVGGIWQGGTAKEEEEEEDSDWD